MKNSRSWFAAGVAALFLCASVWAQTPTGSIEGTVTDPAGAVVPGAGVVVTESGTGRTIPLTTNSSGLYAVRDLLPGTYSVKVTAPGFSAKDLRNVVVNTGSVVNGNVTLDIGKTGEVVEVSAQGISVDTTRQTVDTIVTESQIKNMPLFSRNFLDLAALAPGVVIRDGGVIDPTKTFAYRAVSVAGSSGTGTRVQIDGIDVTDETVGTTTANISDEAVAQFQITRSSLDISTSLTSTGAINVITKSGTNQLHGSGFYDFYNQDLGARLDYNANSEPFSRKRFGVSLGGPILKDRLFFFGNFERTYQNSQARFDSAEFPQLNVSQAFPTALRYALGRVDWNITSAARAFYKFQHNYDLSTGGTPPSPFQNLDNTNTHTVGLDYSRGRLANSLRYGYVNFNNAIISQELQDKFPSLNGQQYQLNVGSYGAGPNGLAPQATYQDNIQISYDGSFLFGKHTIRFGGGYTHIKLGGFANFAGPLTVNGVFDAGTKADLQKAGQDLKVPQNFPLDSFSLGPANGFFTLAPCHNLPHGCHINNRTGIYGGDTIKLTKRLTLNLGLRWEYDSGFFSNDPNVHREPDLELFGRGFSQTPKAPKNLFSPSFGFAFDPTGSGKTAIRGGFYKAYEANIFNNILFDEFAQLPAGIGPDSYDQSGVFGPDGTPINVDGKHPDGDYSDLVGLPIKDTLPTILRVNNALQTAYSTYKFDPAKGRSLFKTSRGNTFGYQLPGNQFKVPYALQFNIGIQHELHPGTVLTVDYIYNHGIGLPYMGVDFEQRRAASTLNVGNATTQVNKVLAGASVDQYIASHPSATIKSFGLATDAIFQGKTPYYTRARLFQGGFTKYRALQANLTGRVGDFMRLHDTQYTVSYSLGRAEASAGAGRAEFLTGPFDNFKPNSKQTFGPSGNDYLHILTASAVLRMPFGFQVNSIWRFRSTTPSTLVVPNLGGAISGANGIFGTDLNGDGGVGGGGPRSDVFPGVNVGQFGRDIGSIGDLNKQITAFNQNSAGKLTPAGQALVTAGLFTEAQLKKLGAVVPTVPLVPSNAPNPWHDLFTTDVRLTRPIKIHSERLSISPFLDVINLFNHAPRNNYAGLSAQFGALNFDYVNAPEGQHASDLAAQALRLNPTRQLQLGIRVDF